jgi:hypothetical protein
MLGEKQVAVDDLKVAIIRKWKETLRVFTVPYPTT